MIDLAIFYHGNPKEVRVHGSIDFDRDGDIDEIRLTSGYVFRMLRGTIRWMSMKQFVVASSTIEVKYIIGSHASKEAIWLHQLCSKIGFKKQAIRLGCHNQSAIFLENNHAHHSKTKHIDVQYHFFKEMIEKRKSLLEKVDTTKNVSELLTKSIST